MLKKISALFATLLIISIACKKEEICTENNSFEVVDIHLKINDENIGLYPNEGKNTATTIGSVRNQLMFTTDKDYKFAAAQPWFHFDFIPSAYAKRCVDVENSRTTFDVNKTQLSINRDLDLSIFGLSGYISAGQNLLAEQKLRNSLLKEVVSNNYIHTGFDFPITISPDFLKHLKGESLTFTLKMFTTIGIEMEASVDVVVDVNA